MILKLNTEVLNDDLIPSRITIEFVELRII